MSDGKADLIPVRVSGRRWLSRQTFELRLERPPAFHFKPGQKISLSRGNLTRDYSLVNAPDDPELAICVRLVEGGELSSLLARAQVDDQFETTPAFGQFLYQSYPGPAGQRPAVLVATGTGVAPYVAFTRSGIKDFLLLHGVRSPEERYYHDALSAGAHTYMPCISTLDSDAGTAFFKGRVTAYLERRLGPGAYDFYLCGRREMIRDAMIIIDGKFPDARVFTEIFF